jgi:EAL domain-containing protein (putative c-di-GMP-specific phosphodiesterase class I)
MGIAKSFIDGLSTDSKEVAILGGILAMAEGLKFYAVIERVESSAQIAILSLLKCKLLQGYCNIRPVPATR